jgi:hypothetical protein
MAKDNLNFEHVPLEAVPGMICGDRNFEEFRPSADSTSEREKEVHLSRLKYPEWQECVRAALLELDEVRLAQRIALAEAVVSRRLKAISQDGGDRAERQALQDALSSLRILKPEPSEPESGPSNT